MAACSIGSHNAQTDQTPFAQRKGYYMLASLMSNEPETALFRRFGALQYLNLLSLQAELTDLEDELCEICADDDISNDVTRRHYSKNFQTLRNSITQGGGQQWNKLVKIGKKLEQYNVALLRASQIDSLGAPTKRKAANLDHWLNDPRLGHPFLSGREANVYSLFQHDLASLHRRSGNEAPFIKWMGASFLDWFHRNIGYRFKIFSYPVDQAFVKYSDKTMIRFAKAVTTILASILPVVSIIVLYFIHNKLARLLATLGFTTLFAMIVSIFTSASESEVFAATAAFAAVEVVFVGSSEISSNDTMKG